MVVIDYLLMEPALGLIWMTKNFSVWGNVFAVEWASFPIRAKSSSVIPVLKS
jgi:hypothetical protein